MSENKPLDFKSLGLSVDLLSSLKKLGYEKPTPIQSESIPLALMGRDVLGCAQTGTGKTASFVLPMIDILNSQKSKARMPRSLILSPTRELADQISEYFKKLSKYHKLLVSLLIGGTQLGDQDKKLNKGVDILIATPGRLIDHINRGNILFNDLIEKQLLLKGIISSADWNVVKTQIVYQWQSDSHFAELQNAQMMRERLGILVNDMGYRDEVVGKFFSQEYVNKQILKLTQEEIDQIKDQIEAEKADAGGGEPEDQQWEFDPSANKPDLKVISG